MDWKIILTVFGSVLLMELGDKTQLATVSFAASHEAKLSVFIGAAGALVVTSLAAVLLGQAATAMVPAAVLKRVSGGIFLAIGILLLVGWF